MNQPGTLLVRADASSDIGVGHVMRCLALAQAWLDRGGRVVFVVESCPEGIARRLMVNRIGVERLGERAGSEADAHRTAALARDVGARWIVVDGYGFGPDYQEALSQGDHRTLVLDDHGYLRRYIADAILNQNIHANECLYPDAPDDTELLLGTSYALLRREFSGTPRGELRRADGQDARAQRVLVTLGGGDPDNATSIVLDGLQRIDHPLDVDVMVGAANPHMEVLQKLALASPHRIRLQINVANVRPFMERADVAVSAGGSTCWELCYLGVPILAVSIADNQRPIAAGLSAAGAALDLGWHGSLTPESVASRLGRLLSDPDRQGSMARVGRKMVDGRGASRVTELLQG